MKKDRINHSHTNHSNKSFKLCNFVNLLILIVLIWLSTLYYYHQANTILYAEEITSQIMSKLAHPNHLLDNFDRLNVNIPSNNKNVNDLTSIELINKDFQINQNQLSQHNNLPINKQDITPSKIILTNTSTIKKSTNNIETTSSTSSSSVTIPSQTQNILDDESLHIVFSTDCSFFQDWQTLLIFHSAKTIQQPGNITRIASGCNDLKQIELISLYHKLYPNYQVHFTPDFKKDTKSGKRYDFYNKPYGVYHWLLNAQPAIQSGTIVIIIDPDMIFLRPITSHIASNQNNIYLKTFKTNVDIVPEKVKKGTPVAQLYGLGAPWVFDNHKHFNRTEICGVDSPCLKTQRSEGEDHYSVGPPYMLERDDLLALITTWTHFVPKVYAKYPELLAEMYAYSMAAAHVQLPHFTLQNLMVSNTFVDDEGWKFIDSLDTNVCEPPVNGIYYPNNLLPNVLHFCQFFRVGEFGFQKRRIKKNLFDCNQPLMADLPRNLGTVNYKNRDGQIMKLGPTQVRRNAFSLCIIHTSMNYMLEHYKNIMCPHSSNPLVNNRNKSINVVSYEYFPW